jgi:S-adenosylhomocysteine hydrolase
MADDTRGSAQMEAVRSLDQLPERAGADLPVLNVIRERYIDGQPLAGSRIALFCPPTLHFAALVTVLTDLGARVRWVPSERGDTSERVRAAVAETGAARLVECKSEERSPWDCFHHAFDWDDGGSANLIVDKDGRAGRLIHWGIAVEAGGAANPSNAEEAAAYDSIRRRLTVCPASYSTIATSIAGLAEFTAFGVERLRQIETAGGLMFPAIDASTGGLSGQAPDRDHVAMDKLAGLLARLLLAQIELFSNGMAYGPGLHRFPDRLKQDLSDCEATAAALGLASHTAARERRRASRDAGRSHNYKA